MGKTDARSLVRATAKRLLADARAQLDLLPCTIGKLADRYSVSYVTMWKAVSMGVECGALISRRGAGVFLSGKRREKRQLPGGAQCRLEEAIRGQIIEGTHVAGGALPKLTYLAHHHHVSLSTVTNAVKCLSRENLVHKVGQQWIVGPPKRTSASAARTDGKTVLILVRTVSEWYALTSYHHPMRFMSAFTEELSRQGFLSVSTCMEPTAGVSHPYPQGFAGVEELLRRTGDSYAGALIVDPSPSAADMTPWVALLSQGQTRPVVFFDSTAQGAACTRSALGASRAYVRAYLDEYEAVKQALDFLAQRGHKLIGAPVYFRGIFEHWAERRLSLIQRYAAESNGRIELFPAEMTEPFWNFGNEWERDVFVEQEIRTHVLKRSERFSAGSFPGRLLRETPSIRGLLDKGVTALVAMNDRAGQEVYRWCNAASVGIPGRVSLISFDNVLGCSIFPISTVDLGMAQLGYLSAHAIIGDFSVRPDAQGNLPATCKVVDRGSVRTMG